MKRIAEHKHYIQWLVVLLAILLPFFIIRVFPGLYHSSDMDDFHRWSQVWQVDWRSIYVNCERCNYPFIGVLLSGGAMSWIDGDSFDLLANRFRYYLAVVDALNVLLVWFILQRLQVKSAALWAGGIGLLPSSWMGSSVWGQIDGAGQFLIFLFFILLIWFNREKRSTRQFFLFAALAGLLFSFMLLTKQLIYFSILALGLIFLANVLTFSRKPIVVIASSAITLIAFALPVVIIDLNLNLKESYFSHLQYVLATGSKHGDIISSVGFNLWVFFTRDLLGSSRLPLPIQIGSKTLFSVTPYSAGIFFFLAINGFLASVLFKQVRKNRADDTQTFNSQSILMSFVYLALVNLSFNLTLTGTHERYLYHFYPFIIITCLAFVNRDGFYNRFTLSVLLAGSLVYGAFLFGYLTRFVRATSFMILQGMSIFHLLLFAYLIYITVKQIDSRTMDSPSLT
ncbi:MAG: hypothetical protein HYZ22_12450 [Chloroflexi bacterium]|nr:hypothetical protein [Chloroflexota bacterium]